MRIALSVAVVLIVLIGGYFGYRIHQRSELKDYDQRIAALEAKKFDEYAKVMKADPMPFDEADKRGLLLSPTESDELAELRHRVASLKADGISDPSN